MDNQQITVRFSWVQLINGKDQHNQDGGSVATMAQAKG